MPPIRVLVAGAAGLLHDIVVRAVSAQPDMQLLPVGVQPADTFSASHAPAVDATIFVVKERADAESILRELFPRQLVVAVYTSGERLAIYSHELRLESQVRGELTAEGVLDAIRRHLGQG